MAQAFVYSNLASIHARRDIGMLGVVCRSFLSFGPFCFSRFFSYCLSSPAGFEMSSDCVIGRYFYLAGSLSRHIVIALVVTGRFER